MNLTLNNDISSLKVGDYFWSYAGSFNNYYLQHTSNLFPSYENLKFGDFATKTDSEITDEMLLDPNFNLEKNGYFKFIVVEIKKDGTVVCMADRIIKTSTRLDYFKSYYNGLTQLYGQDISRFTNYQISKNLAVGGLATSYSYLSSGYPTRAFDDSYSTYYYPLTMNLTPDDYWTAYEFLEPVEINAISMTTNYNIKTYFEGLELEYSDDGVNWHYGGKAYFKDLPMDNTGENQSNIMYFGQLNVGEHLHWRFNFTKDATSNMTGYGLYIYKIEMHHVKEDDTLKNNFKDKGYEVSIRVPSSSVEINKIDFRISEWDKWVTSEIGMTDNNNLTQISDIWNINEYTITSTLGTHSSKHVARGSAVDPLAFLEVGGTSVYNTPHVESFGLRPVIEIKKTDNYKAKLFIEDNTQFKTYTKPKKGVLVQANLIPDFVDDGSTLETIQHGMKLVVDSGYAWKLFSSNNDTWISDYNKRSLEVLFDFGVTNDKRVGGYKIDYRLQANNGRGEEINSTTYYQDEFSAPRDWDIYGSTLGTEWVFIERREDVQFGLQETKEFIFDKPHTYRFFKFVFHSNNGNPYYLAINQLSLHDIYEPKVKPYWKSMGTLVPSVNDIVKDGMDDLTPLHRKDRHKKFTMEHNGAFSNGNIYKAKLPTSTNKSIVRIKKGRGFSNEDSLH